MHIIFQDLKKLCWKSTSMYVPTHFSWNIFAFVCLSSKRRLVVFLKCEMLSRCCSRSPIDNLLAKTRYYIKLWSSNMETVWYCDLRTVLEVLMNSQLSRAMCNCSSCRRQNLVWIPSTCNCRVSYEYSAGLGWAYWARVYCVLRGLELDNNRSELLLAHDILTIDVVLLF